MDEAVSSSSAPAPESTSSSSSREALSAGEEASSTFTSLSSLSSTSLLPARHGESANSGDARAAAAAAIGFLNGDVLSISATKLGPMLIDEVAGSSGPTPKTGDAGAGAPPVSAGTGASLAPVPGSPGAGEEASSVITSDGSSTSTSVLHCIADSAESTDVLAAAASGCFAGDGIAVSATALGPMLMDEVSASPAPKRETGNARTGARPASAILALPNAAGTSAPSGPAPLSGDMGTAEAVSGPGRPSGRRRRWDQAPSRCSNCPTGGAERIMTCCRAILCVDCAECNPCGCHEWQEGFGLPVPLLPRHEVPEDCLVDYPVLLPRPRWQLFYTYRSCDTNVWYFFYNAEHWYHSRDRGVVYQIHRYVTVGRSWTRLYCSLVVLPQFQIIANFAVPPRDQADLASIRDLARSRRRHH